jgi:hypothetical protein
VSFYFSNNLGKIIDMSIKTIAKINAIAKNIVDENLTKNDLVFL